MARKIRNIIPEQLHHITQRGNHKEKIFRNIEDRIVYLSLLKTSIIKYNIKIAAFCLMSNHVHFILLPPSKSAISRCMMRMQGAYAQYYNEKVEIQGHLWQGRYYSCPMDQQHAFNALKYIENNPVRAGIAEKAWEFGWSTAGWRCKIFKIPCGVPVDPNLIIEPCPEWRDELDVRFDEHWINKFNFSTYHGGEMFGDECTYKRKGRPIKLKMLT